MIIPPTALNHRHQKRSKGDKIYFMKKAAILIFLFAIVVQSRAQHVRVKVGFPAGISVRAPGPRPFASAIWIGPEWQWRGGKYIVVPGYWAKPKHPRATWVPGYWKHSRRGYRWIPGHWR